MLTKLLLSQLTGALSADAWYDNPKVINCDTVSWSSGNQLWRSQLVLWQSAVTLSAGPLAISYDTVSWSSGNQLWHCQLILWQSTVTQSAGPLAISCDTVSWSSGNQLWHSQLVLLQSAVTQSVGPLVISCDTVSWSYVLWYSVLLAMAGVPVVLWREHAVCGISDTHTAVSLLLTRTSVTAVCSAWAALMLCGCVCACAVGIVTSTWRKLQCDTRKCSLVTISHSNLHSITTRVKWTI